MESKSQYGSRIACEGIQNSIDRLYKSIQDYLKRSKEEKIMKNKNWEILSFSDGFNIYTKHKLFTKDPKCFSINQARWYTEEELLNVKKYLIHSVKRLSDGEVFTIGDTIDNFRTETTIIPIIKEIKIGKDDLIILSADHWCCELNVARKKSKSIKPPLGIIPRKLWIDERILDLNSAILRYKEAGKEWPKEWDEESIELIAEKYDIPKAKINGFYDQSSNWCCTDKKEEKKEWEIISFIGQDGGVIRSLTKNNKYKANQIKTPAREF